MSSKAIATLPRPSLLDQLFETDAPGGGRSLVDNRGRHRSLSDLKAAVIRDLSWLLNANSLDQTVDLHAYPHVADSTLNYGAPALDGQSREGLDLYRFQESIALSLRRFEPRLMPETLQVTSSDNGGQGGAISIHIEADLRAEPLPLRVVMRTEIDPEIPAIRVVECREEGFA